MRSKRPNQILYDESTNPSNGWRAPDADDDPAAELKASAEFEREMLALVPNPVDDGEVDDVRVGGTSLQQFYDSCGG